MFQKLISSLKKTRAPLTPTQGQRIDQSTAQNGEFTLTIRGQKFPGFFIIFGLIFGGIPSIILFAILFGTSDSENDAGGIIATLFLIPFFLIGASTFFIGLFLWLGRTVIQIGPHSASIQRKLFGKAFQTKEFDRATLDLQFEESHKSNDVPSYKLNFQDSKAKNKIGVGGSLKEAELLWLEREVRQALGKELIPHNRVAETIKEGSIDDITETIADPDYRSRNLQFTKTTQGWEAKVQTTFLAAIFMTLFGSIFLLAGLIMATPTREFLLDLFPAIREAFADSTSSGDPPPIWFAMIFGGAGLAIMLSSLFALGYHCNISKRHSRLHRERRWLIFMASDVFQISDLTKLAVKTSGNVNDDPRYRLTAHFKNGKKAKLLSFATPEDAGQLYARLRIEMNAERD